MYNEGTQTIQIINDRLIILFARVVDMANLKPINLYRNLICASIALLLLFSTAIFVLTSLYQKQIDQLIDDATLLKDHKYPTWGAFMPGPNASYQQTLTLNNLSATSEKADPMVFDYQFSYRNVSFGQGDQGTIKYLNSWQHNLLENDLQKSSVPEEKNITTVNLAVERLYSYEYYAPLSRKFVLNFNFMWQSIKDTLPRIYGLYLHQYYLQDQQVVTKAIFDPANLPAETRTLIMNHPTYGWQDPENLAHWMRLVNLNDEMKQSHPVFELIMEAIELSEEELMRLVGPRSALFKLSSALNGTIKNKVEANAIGYEGCVPFCSDDQLVSLQLTTGYLTNSPIMGKLSLNKLFNQLNSSYPRSIEYSAFCDSRPDLSCIDKKNAIITFDNQVFNNFTLMSTVIENLNNYELVETIFQVENPMGDGSYGQSLIEYMLYLNSQVYTPYDEQQQRTDSNAYRLMFPNYEYLLRTLNYFEEALSVQLLTLAGAHVILSHNLTCQNFYEGKYQDLADLCLGEETDPTQVESLRLFVQAHLFLGESRSHFLNLTAMDQRTAASFLRLDTENSLFASMLNKIKADLAKSFNCAGTTCTGLELLAREWGGSDKILDKLPKAYFPSGQLDIFEIDYADRFAGLDPRFWKITGSKLSKEQSMAALGKEEQSIVVLISLVNHASKFSKDPLSTSLVRYVQRLVIDRYFGSYYTTADLKSLIFGHSADAIALKQQMQPNRGGAPWLSNNLSIIETKHAPQRFNKLNTGIYDKDRLRAILQVQGQTKANSEYTVYEYEFESVKEILLAEKDVRGTNMLGFHQGITAGQQLSVYLGFINYAGTLTNGKDSEFSQGNTPCLNYSLSASDTGRPVAIGIEQQNQRFAIIDPSSFLVAEPITGVTLEMYFKYTVFANVTTIAWYSEGETQQKQLYQMEVRYKRADLSSIYEIRDRKAEMKTLTIIMISCASFSMLLVIIFGVLYARARKGAARTDIMESLATSEPTV